MEPIPEARSELDTDFDENDRIFHYTSSEGLAGVFGANCLWATHFMSLNDRQEFMHARDALVSFVARQMAKRLAALKVNGRIVAISDAPAIMDTAHSRAVAFVDYLYGAMFGVHQPFVFSGFICNKADKYAFNNGVLQHWGTYGGGGGFSIQINPHTLADNLRENEERFLGDLWSTGKVDYTDGLEPPVLLRPHYEELGKYAQEFIERRVLFPDQKSPIHEIISSFVKITSYSKHHFFKIEQEARMVIMRLTRHVDDMLPHDVHVRAAKNDIVSYIKVLDGVLLGSRCAIEKIIVGPGGDRDRRCDSLREYLRMRRISVEVSVSEIPYLPR